MELGLEVSYLKIGAYPVPKKLILELLETVDTVLVFEELEPIVEEQVKMIAQEAGIEVSVLGKTNGFVPREGELDVSAFLEVLKKTFDLETEAETSGTALELAPRPPALCAGCSHRATFYSMKKVFGKDAIYPSDIGCYTLGIQSGTVETTLCMGSSISVASGLYHEKIKLHTLSMLEKLSNSHYQ